MNRVGWGFRLLVVVWLGSCLGGMYALWQYSNLGNRTSVTIPVAAGSLSETLLGQPHSTLMVFVHPQCPCTHATVAELTRLQATVSKPVALRSYVFAPHPLPPDWLKSRILKNLDLIGGMETILDWNGERARAHGVQYSGHVQIFNSEGRLSFDGGITAGRGHEGDNLGQSLAVEAIDHPDVPSCRTAPVLGCMLLPSE